MYSPSLLSELRRKIQDVHPTFQCLSVGVTDSSATRAVLECTQGHLILTCAGGTVRGFDIDLLSPRFDTVGKLADQISRMTGMSAVLDNDVNRDHPSNDIDAFGPMDVLTQAFPLRHHYFSDIELQGLVQGAISRHNPSLTPQTLPRGEWELALTLAHAEVLRLKATDATKRKGTSETVADLLALVRDLEEKYTRDSRRLNRVLQSPKEPLGHRVSQGDVMLGTLFRRSLRTGQYSPSSAALPPPPLVLLEPDDQDDADVDVRVRWERTNESAVHTIELWMDTQPDVIRSLGQSQGDLEGREATDDTTALRETTSTRVGRWAGPNFIGNGASGPAFIENSGHLAKTFVVAGLEPETDYYFRLYLFTVNSEASASNVVGHRTKPKRVKFSSTSPATPTVLSAGDTLTLNFDADWGVYSASTCTLTLGGKVLGSPVVVSPTQIRVTVPSFHNLGFKDLVLRSPTGLTHVLKNAVEVR